MANIKVIKSDEKMQYKPSPGGKINVNLKNMYINQCISVWNSLILELSYRAHIRIASLKQVFSKQEKWDKLAVSFKLGMSSIPSKLPSQAQVRRIGSLVSYLLCPDSYWYLRPILAYPVRVWPWKLESNVTITPPRQIQIKWGWVNQERQISKSRF